MLRTRRVRARRLLRNAMLSRQRGTILSLPKDVDMSCPSKASYVRLLGAQTLLRDLRAESTVARIQAVLELSDRLLEAVSGFTGQ